MLWLVRRLVRQDKYWSPVVVGVLVGHTLGDLVGTPADEHGAGGVHDLRKRVLFLVLDDPVHRVVGAGDEAVQRHRPVHNDLAQASIRIAHADDGTTALSAGRTCSGATPGMLTPC